MRPTHKPHIKVAQHDSENGVALLEVTSTLGNRVELLVDADSFTRWENGELIHRCFPELSLEERELLISGMDYEEQKIVFGKPELE